MLDLSIAFKIAARIHGGQRDRAGQPYMCHICRVAAAVDDETERVVAILHDALEDCGNAERERICKTVLAVYGEEVLDAIKALTRSRGEPYSGYISRVALNPVAARVKLKDLFDNMREDRLARLPGDLASNLRHRYNEAYNSIESELSRGSCPRASS